MELALIIGRRGKYIDVNKALDYVFGYLILNDVSMRDWQFPSKEPTEWTGYTARAWTHQHQ